VKFSLSSYSPVIIPVVCQLTELACFGGSALLHVIVCYEELFNFVLHFWKSVVLFLSLSNLTFPIYSQNRYLLLFNFFI
jgi:hypothetical protein